MKIATYTFENDFACQLAIDLIPNGIEAIGAKTRDDLIEIIDRDKSIELLLSETPEKQFLLQVKETRPDLPIFLIYHNNFKTQELMDLMKLGVVALVEYSDKIDIITDNIIYNIAQHIDYSEDRRKHFRIEPAPYEKDKVYATITIREIERSFRAKITNISAGGVAVKIKKALSEKILEKGHVYSPFLLQFRGMGVKTIAKLVGIHDDVAGFKFENVEKSELRKISTYIYMRMQENLKIILF